MKHRLSVTVNEETVRQIQDKLRSGLFRNKSHIVEHAINKFLRED